MIDLLVERTNRGLSQEQMASTIGVTRRVYQAAEARTSVPRGRNALAFAAFFHCEVAALFPPQREREAA